MTTYLALATLAFGCSAKRRASTDTDAGSIAMLTPSRIPIALPTVAVPDLARVVLLQSGSEPRRTLRYHPSVGATQTLRLTSTYIMSISTGEHKMFARTQKLAVELTLTVTRIATNGDVHLKLHIRELESQVTGPVFDPQSKPKQFDGTAVVSARAVVLSLDIPEIEHNEDKRDLLSLTDYFHPLPEAPVGIGAKWDVHSSYVRNGLTMDSVDTHTLVELAGDTLKTHQSSRQHARPQLMTTREGGPWRSSKPRT